jgi:hypothetical protein
MKHRVIAIVMAMGIVLPLGIVSANPALAAGCWADSCKGYDPEYKGCDGNVQNLEQKDGVTLRYSQDCDAVWARAQWEDNIIVQGSYDQQTIVAEYGNDVRDPQANVTWTYMVSFGEWTRACIQLFGSDSWSCTGWH